MKKPTSIEELNSRIAVYLKWHKDLASKAKAYRDSCKFGVPVEMQTVASNDLLDHAFNGGLEPGVSESFSRDTTKQGDV